MLPVPRLLKHPSLARARFPLARSTPWTSGGMAGSLCLLVTVRPRTYDGYARSTRSGIWRWLAVRRWCNHGTCATIAGRARRWVDPEEEDVVEVGHLIGSHPVQFLSAPLPFHELGREGSKRRGLFGRWDGGMLHSLLCCTRCRSERGCSSVVDADWLVGRGYKRRSVGVFVAWKRSSVLGAAGVAWMHSCVVRPRPSPVPFLLRLVWLSPSREQLTMTGDFDPFQRAQGPRARLLRSAGAVNR